MNKRPELSDEYIKPLIQFCELLIEWDMEENPEQYTDGNTERADALPTHQATQKDQTGK
jgi:hypothetical protein